MSHRYELEKDTPEEAYAQHANEILDDAETVYVDPSTPARVGHFIESVEFVN